MKTFELENKVYFSILSIFSFGILLYCLIKINIIDFELIILSFGLVSVILLTSYYFVIIDRIKFYPINIFFNLYFLISFLFFLYNFEYILNKTYSDTFSQIEFNDFYFLTKEVIKLLTLTVLFLNLGFILVEKLLKKKNFNFLPNLSELDLLRLNFFLISIKLIFILGNFFFDINIKEIENPLSLLIASISFYLILLNKKNNFINLLIIFYLFCENAIMTYSIYKNTILLLVFFILIYNFKKKISLIIISILVLWVMFGQTLKVPLRNNYLVKYNKEISKNMQKYDILEKLNTNPLILRLSEPIVSFIRVLEFEKIRKKNVHKDTLSILFYSPIPRFVLKDKPTQNFAYWYTDYFFDIYQFKEFDFTKTVTYNIFWPTDFYLNFGIYGSTIFAFIFGIFISFLLKILTNFNSNNIQSIFGISIFSSLSLPDYNLSLMLSPILLQYLAIFLLLKFILIIIKK